MTTLTEKLNAMKDMCEVEPLTDEEKYEFLNLTSDEREIADKYGLIFLDAPFLANRMINSIIKTDMTEYQRSILSTQLCEQFKDQLLPEELSYICDSVDTDEGVKKYLEEQKRSNSLDIDLVSYFDDEVLTSEIRTIDDDKGNHVMVSMVNKKRHGAMVLYDSEGNIQNMKLYNMGKEIDLNKHTVEIKNEMLEKNGQQIKGFSVTLDGKPFGQQIVTCDDIGQITFYDLSGKEIGDVPYNQSMRNLPHNNNSSELKDTQYLMAMAEKYKNNTTIFENRVNKRQTTNHTHLNNTQQTNKNSKDTIEKMKKDNKQYKQNIKNITQNDIQENTQTPTLNENNTMQNKNLRNIQLASIDIDR